VKKKEGKCLRGFVFCLLFRNFWKLEIDYSILPARLIRTGGEIIWSLLLLYHPGPQRSFVFQIGVCHSGHPSLQEEGGEMGAGIGFLFGAL
jgi:hypothetical protein